MVIKIRSAINTFFSLFLVLRISANFRLTARMPRSRSFLRSSLAVFFFILKIQDDLFKSSAATDLKEKKLVVIS